MSGFKFKLEKVREYRQRLEEEAMMAFSRARMELEALKEKKLALHEEAVENNRKLNAAEGLSGADRWLLLSYRSALDADIEYCAEQIMHMEPEVERLRLELAAKAQDRQLMDKLKEKQAERYANEEKYKEQQQYDETATLRYRPQTF